MNKKMLLKTGICLTGILVFMVLGRYGSAEDLVPRIDFEKIISTDGSDRALSYYMSNKILTARGKMFMGWLDRPEIRIGTYHIANDVWDEAVEIGRRWDNHSGPTITMDSEGYLYTISGAHNTPFWFRISTNPYNASSWEIETEGDGVSDALEILMYGTTYVYMTETGLFTDNDRDERIDIVEFLLHGDLDTFHDSDNDYVVDDIEVLIYGDLDVYMRSKGLLTDDDDDGIADLIEFLLCGDLDISRDDDLDGIIDHFELALYGSLSVDFAENGILTDHNDDGLADVVEFILFSDPAFFEDTDGDGVIDDIEIALYDNLTVDMTASGVLTDSDGDSGNEIPDILEMLLNGDLASDTVEGEDGDWDSVNDELEILMYGDTSVNMRLEGLLTDSDEDGIADTIEFLLSGGLDFLDSDGDGAIDHVENVLYGSLGVNMTRYGLRTDNSGNGIADIVEFILAGDPVFFEEIEDADDDGVIDSIETFIYGGLDIVDMSENGLLTDNDADEIADIYEVLLFGNLVLFNGSEDTDTDGVIDDFERALYGSLGVDMSVDGILTDFDGDDIFDILEKLLNGNLDSSVIDPGDLEDNDEIVVGSRETYPSLVIDNEGTLHLTSRSHDSGNHKYQHKYGCVFGVIYRRKEKGGEWSQPLELARAGTNSGYSHFGNHIAIGRDGTLHVAFHLYRVKWDSEQRRNIAKVLGFSYLRSTDNGQTWENVNGEEKVLPIGPSDTDCLIDVRETYSYSLRVNGLVIDNDGHVFVSMIDSGGARDGCDHWNHQIIWQHDGDEWTSNHLLPHVKKVYPDGSLYVEQAHGQVSIGMGGKVIYAASGGKMTQGGSRGMFLFASDDKGETFQVRYEPMESSFGSYALSIEKPFSPKPLKGIPSVIYHNNNIPSRIILMRSFDAYSPAVASADITGSGKDAGVINFRPRYGIRVWWENRTWVKLHDFMPELMARGNILRTLEGEQDLAIDFGGEIGLLVRHADGSWTKLHNLSPKQMVSGDINKDGLTEVVIDFGEGLGLRTWTGQWEFIDRISPECMVTGDMNNDGYDEIIMGLKDEGLKVRYYNGDIIGIHELCPEIMVTGDVNGDNYDEIVIYFGKGLGLYIYYPETRNWKKIHNLDINSVVLGQIDGDPEGKKDLMVDFEGYGLRLWRNDSTWIKVHDLNAEWMLVGDYDDSGQDDVIIDFGDGPGLWVLDNGRTWRKLHDLSP